MKPRGTVLISLKQVSPNLYVGSLKDKQNLNYLKKSREYFPIQDYFCHSYLIHVMSLKWASGRFFLHFREIFEKCIEYIGKFLVHFREILNFCEKVVHFRQILPLISWSLPDEEGGITCMLSMNRSLKFLQQFFL